MCLSVSGKLLSQLHNLNNIHGENTSRLSIGHTAIIRLEATKGKKTTMRFIEKCPRNAKALILVLNEEKEQPPEDEKYAMNFSLVTQDRIDVADGRCSIDSESESESFMHISAIYVEGHTNTPTKINPNQYVGLGQILVFAAIKFGFERQVRMAKLTSLDGSEGFYLKMGFHPEVTGNPNRMAARDSALQSRNGKLNPDWVKGFAKSSFLNRDFRGPMWTGSIADIYPRLRTNIQSSWLIVE